MKVVHAEWELRNLGVVCVEITVEPIDADEEILGLIDELNVEYLVLRVPCGNARLLKNLQDSGLKVVETVFQCEHDGVFQLASPLKRLLSACTVHGMDGEKLEILHDEISAGMFTDDRVSIDPAFDQVRARDRYWNWVNDELRLGGSVYTIMHNDDVVGFFGLSAPKGNRTSVFLSGLYKRYRKSGIGFVAHCLGVQTAIKNGAFRAVTSFSANNRMATSLHMQLQHRIVQSWYVLVDHRSLKEGYAPLKQKEITCQH